MDSGGTSCFVAEIVLAAAAGWNTIDFGFADQSLGQMRAPAGFDPVDGKRRRTWQRRRRLAGIVGPGADGAAVAEIAAADTVQQRAADSVFDRIADSVESAELVVDIAQRATADSTVDNLPLTITDFVPGNVPEACVVTSDVVALTD